MNAYDQVVHTRVDGRSVEALRPVSIVRGVSRYAEGSAEVSFGNTRVLCTASVESGVPKWMENPDEGWITAEYGMLPRSTHTRNRREASAGKQGGRTVEIQRLIGRALRRAVDLRQIAGVTIQVDCDVLCADGGTRTAAISGAWVALWEALQWAKREGLVKSELTVTHVAAVSVGRAGGVHMLDLCYEEDSAAEFDMNLVLNEHRQIIEVQGTGEKGEVESEELIKLLDLGGLGGRKIIELQRKALAA